MVLTATATPGADTQAPLLWGRDDWARVNFRAMASPCQLIYRAPSRRQAQAFRDEAVGWVTSFEQRYSRYREDSLISAINRAAGQDWVATDAELESIFALCDHYHWSTAGVFDPSSLPLMRVWNYQAEKPVVPSDAQIAQALERVGWQKVQRRAGAVHLPEAGMAIDLGGIGKEYAVDRVLEMAAPFGITDIMVDFGRDVRGRGNAPSGGTWRVGLEDPRHPGQCWSGVLAANRAVATSGDYIRGFECDGRYYSHILDPRTGRPIANGAQSATVIAPNCTEAGVLATALLILGSSEGLALVERSTFAQGCLWQSGRCHETSRFATYLD
jgi:thiamine biosynthesis lipoprotein